MCIRDSNELASSTFVNYSHEDIRRVDMSMDVHYDSDVELAKKIILRVIDEHPYALKAVSYTHLSEL